MTAYEVSVSKLAAYDNAETFDADAEFYSNKQQPIYETI
jgi:hypothetical protein